MFEVFGAHWMRMQLETSEIREPRKRRRIARYKFLSGSARREVQLNHFDPRWPGGGRALLIEVLAFNSIRISNQHVGPTACASQCSLCHCNVIANEVELGVLGLRE